MQFSTATLPESLFQCFGEEIFEHLPCDDGLVFNEISGGCDYKSNVPECAATSEKSKEGNLYF